MDSPDRPRAARPRLPGPLDALAQRGDALAQRGIAGAASLVAESVDLNDFIRHVDLNALLDQVDVDRLLQRVDLNALLAKVDLDAVLARLDLDALLERVDLTALLARSSAGAASETVHDVEEGARRLEDSAESWAGHLFHHPDRDSADGS